MNEVIFIIRTVLSGPKVSRIEGSKCTHVCTVEPVYNVHSRDQVTVVSVDRWSLYGGASVKVKWTINQPAVVSIDRWSLYASGL